MADARYRRRIVLSDNEIGLYGIRAFHEQTDRCESIQLAKRGDCVRRWERQGWDAAGHFAIDTQRCSTRGKDAHIGASSQQRPCELCTCIDEMLTVVEYEQELA